MAFSFIYPCVYFYLVWEVFWLVYFLCTPLLYNYKKVIKKFYFQILYSLDNSINYLPLFVVSINIILNKFIFTYEGQRLVDHSTDVYLAWLNT